MADSFKSGEKNAKINVLFFSGDLLFRLIFHTC
jgi:hypothetical protein